MNEEVFKILEKNMWTAIDENNGLSKEKVFEIIDEWTDSFVELDEYENEEDKKIVQKYATQLNEIAKAYYRIHLAMGDKNV